MSILQAFGPATRRWFEGAFSEPTPVQRRGWERIAAREHSLLLAPTGSGKTLAAFLWCLDHLTRRPTDAPPGTRVVYVSPLKALAYDVQRNLRAPLVGIARAAEALGEPLQPVQVDLRTGDTSQAERRRQSKAPAEILVTTPESLFLVLGSKAREGLRGVSTVIVDEIHALAGTKRGVHLALTLERLAAFADSDPQRIGLSATQRPLEEIAAFLGGDRSVATVDAGEPPNIDLQVSVPVADMSRPHLGYGQPEPQASGSLLAVAAAQAGEPRRAGIWPAIHPVLLELIERHRSTIVFCNSRLLSERLCQRLVDLATELDAGPTPALRAHHGSLARPQRVEIEEALKRGDLDAIVATSSLELGVDMGAVDLVIQVESPGSVARGLQRIGRAGHQVGVPSSGRIFPKYRGDLLECAVVAREMLAGRIEATRVPRCCLDVLAQQIVALCGEKEQGLDEIEALVRRAYPYRELGRDLLVAVLDMLAGRYPADVFAELRPRLVWDRETDRLRTRRDAVMLSRLNVGTIPDRGLYRVQLGPDGPIVGELDEEMVHESRPGETFVLGATSWRIQEIGRDRVVVTPAPGQPGKLPFWRGTGPGRPVELGRALGSFVREVAALERPAAERLLGEQCKLDPLAVRNLLDFLAEQQQDGAALPTDRCLVVERFRDELGDWRVCLLSPFGSRVHAPWAMAVQARIEQAELARPQVLWSDDGIVFRWADTDELPPLDLLIPDPEEVEELVLGGLQGSAVFAAHFRESAARALLLPRRNPRKRTPLWAQRLRAQSLLDAVSGFPGFPILLETVRELLQDVFDLPGLKEVLRDLRARRVALRSVETPSASPFARSLVFDFVARYLYEGDLPLAERKAQALTLDRALLAELLGQEELRDLLDPGALAELEAELQALAEGYQARSPDSLHDLLRRVGDLAPAELPARCVGDAAAWALELQQSGRAVSLHVAGEARWLAVEDLARYRDALGSVPPAGVAQVWLEPAPEPMLGLLRRWARTHGPFRAEQPAARWGLRPSAVVEALTTLERAGELVRGELRPGGYDREWCDPGVLRRLRRRSLARLRKQIAPVDGPALARFLPEWQGLGGGQRGAQRLLQVVDQLQGLALPWSELVGRMLPARVADFRPALLDELGARGELVWVGGGALGVKDGRVALYRRSQAAALLPPAAPFEPSSPLAAALLEHLQRHGACFTTELAAAAEGAPTADVVAALWDLAWAGQVSNDTFLPLHSLRAPPRRRVAGVGGRWWPVERLRSSTPEPTQRLLAQAQALLERYGILTREMALSEELPGGFAALYPVLKVMEESGRVRRGWFVDGLGGAQFALPGALDRLRACREPGTRTARVLAACDPANPYGSLLSWPEPAGAGRPRRVAGAQLVTVDGRPALFADRGGRRLVTFPGPSAAEVPGGEDLADALAAMKAGLRRQRKRRLRVDRIDDAPALESPFAPILEAAGFRRDYRCLVWEEL